MDAYTGAHCLEAYLVVKSTVVDYGVSRSNCSEETLEGNFPRGANVHAFGVVSDEERDALDRVVTECARPVTDEDEDEDRGMDMTHLEFGEPGWFEVARETSG